MFDALLSAIPRVGMRIDRHDRSSGLILVKAGMSMRSWGETIPISVMASGPTSTRVSITSTPRTGLELGGAFDFGKNRDNINKILFATAEALKGKPRTPRRPRKPPPRKNPLQATKRPPTPPADAAEPSSLVAPVEPVSSSSPRDRLATLKSLLDDGLIDQADFDRRKREILSEI